MTSPRVILTRSFPRPGNEEMAGIVNRKSVGAGFAWLSPRSEAHRFKHAAREFASPGLRDVLELDPGVDDSAAARSALARQFIRLCT